MDRAFVEAFGLSLPELAQGIVEYVVPEGEPTDGQLVLDFLGLSAYTFSDPDTEVRAVLDPNERTVLIHEELSDNQRKWSSMHEAGHYALPEHNRILWECKLSDLDFLTRKRLELEANRFAAELVFQGDRFRLDAAALPIGFASLKSLQKRYGVSLESTARQYVEESYYPCALVVYDVSPRPPVPSGTAASVTVRYTVTSSTFTGFRYLLPKRPMPEGTPPQLAARLPAWEATRGELGILNTVTGDRRVYQTELFHNSYRLFQLVLDEGAPG